MGDAHLSARDRAILRYGESARDRWCRHQVPGKDGCSDWQGSLSDGYGEISLRGVTVSSHRLAFFLAHSRLPAPGMVLNHICRNRRCCAADHLEEVTNRENVLAGIGPSAVNAEKTVCRRGHPYEGDNLVVDNRGFRVCRTCKRAADSRYNAKRRAVRDPSRGRCSVSTSRGLNCRERDGGCAGASSGGGSRSCEHGTGLVGAADRTPRSRPSGLTTTGSAAPTAALH